MGYISGTICEKDAAAIVRVRRGEDIDAVLRELFPRLTGRYYTEKARLILEAAGPAVPDTDHGRLELIRQTHQDILTSASASAADKRAAAAALQSVMRELRELRAEDAAADRSDELLAFIAALKGQTTENHNCLHRPNGDNAPTAAQV